jgi:hypothetical protein
MMSEELKPCPFCGRSDLTMLETWFKKESAGYLVSCLTDGCPASNIDIDGEFYTAVHDWDTKEEAIKAWNTRHPPAVDSEKVMAQGGGVDAFDAAVEAARNLGATQAKRMAGVYTQTDAVVERGLHEAIAKHRRALLASAPAGTVGDGWIAVGDRLPDGNQTVALLMEDGVMLTGWAVYWHPSGEFSEFVFPTGNPDDLKVLAWYPLPAPAATKEGE